MSFEVDLVENWQQAPIWIQIMTPSLTSVFHFNLRGEQIERGEKRREEARKKQERAINGKREFFQLKKWMRQMVFSAWGIETGPFAPH